MFLLSFGVSPWSSEPAASGLAALQRGPGPRGHRHRPPASWHFPLAWAGGGRGGAGGCAVPKLCCAVPARTHPCALREMIPAERVVQVEAHHVAVSQREVLLHRRAAAAAGRRAEEEEARAVLPAPRGGARGGPAALRVCRHLCGVRVCPWRCGVMMLAPPQPAVCVRGA